MADYYNVGQTEKKPVKKGKIITINRAELSKYYTLEELDESVAEFEGRVEIVIDDTEKHTQHSIIADKVNFNRTSNSVTALGNVEYIKTEKGNTEFVTAESLTFNLTNWKGSLLRCVSKQDKVIKEESMVFYYVTGEIKKSDTDVMGMNDVAIQTVPGSPYFNISALDLWMLGSSEFVIVLPSIKIGHVPVFAFPFYYHTDNNLYFNPVYGVKSREGTTFQNTLYLMGAKAKSEEESDFSFLAFDNGEDATNLELNGLSLVPSEDKEKYSDDFSKIMIDYYSNLGFFLGNTTSLNFKKNRTKIDFNGGIGFSRNIDDSDGKVFVEEESNWNSSYILGNEVPFRYMVDLTIKSPIVNIYFKSFSDLYFKTDFYNREEDFKWIDYGTKQLDAGVESFNADDSEDETYTRTVMKDSPILTTYNIGFDFAKIAPKVNILNPFIKKFIFDIGKVELDFASKISKESNDDDALVSTYKIFDPNYKFYYPKQTIIPISSTLSGKLFDTSLLKNKKGVIVKNNKNNYKFDNPLLDISNPTKSKIEKSEELHDDKEKVEVENIQVDKPFGDINIGNSSTNGFMFSNKLIATDLAYNVNAPVKLYGYWDSDEWYNHLDINYDLSERAMLYHFDPNMNLTYKLGLLDSLFTASDILKTQIYSKSYLEDDEEKDLKDVYKWNKTLIKNDLSLKLDIFKPFVGIKKHSLIFNYNLNKLLYEKSFDEERYVSEGSELPYYLEKEFEWTEDYIKKNEFKGNYKYKLDFSDTTLGYSKLLPPFDEKDTLNLKQNFDFDIFTHLNNKSTTDFKYDRTLVVDDSEEEVKVDDELIEIYSLTQSNSLSIIGIKTTVNGGFDYSDSFVTEINEDDSGEEESDEWDLKPVKLGFEYKYLESVKLSLGSEYSLEDEVWNKYNGSIILGDFKILFDSSYAYPISWDNDNLRWITNSDEDEILEFNSLSFYHSFDIKQFKFWKNRVTLDIDSDLFIKKEFIKVDTSEFKYTLNFTLDIYEFLHLKLVATSKNSSLYQYWESDYSKLGLHNGENMLSDFMKSFNFFSDSDREESSFNLYSISLDSIYKMPDWNLIFNYTGKPELKDNKYNWYQVFSLFVEWKPLSLVRSDVVNDDENWNVSTSAQE